MNKEKLTERIKKISSFVLITFVCSLINILGSYTAQTFQLPFWLDDIGTYIAAYYTNVFGAIISSTSVNFVLGHQNEFFYVYAIASAFIAIFIRLLVRAGCMKDINYAMLSSAAICIVTIAFYIPFTIAFNDGRTGIIWGDALFDMLEFKGLEMGRCAAAAESLVDVVDVQLEVFLSFLIIKYVDKVFLDKNSNHNIEKVGIFLLFLVLGIVGYSGKIVYAKEQCVHFSDYIKTIYDNTSGLPASGVNVIEQTPDGYIWIGGYAGLCRYDGKKFEHIKEGGVANVTSMIVDAEGSLWIGTNDRGIVVYKDEEFHFINKEMGLPENSIRSLYESKSGDIYVGTTGNTCKISKSFDILPIEEAIIHVRSFSENKNGLMACVDFDGNLMLLHKDKLIARKTIDEENAKYTAVLATEDNNFWVGTSLRFIERVSYLNGELQKKEQIDIGNLQNVCAIEKDKKGNLWISTYTGIGHIMKNNKFTELQYPGFDNAIEDFMQDYEGNYWFASSNYGVMKLCKSSFSDVYSFLGLEKKVVNAVQEWNGDLYCGTDTGLDIINLQEKEKVENKLTELVGTHRVRCMREDKEGRLWICTYGKGLICYNGEEDYQIYTKEEYNTAGNYFRCLEEMKDGTMVAGGSEGLTFIKNGKVIDTITKNDGLDITQILCLAIAEDGTIYAGSDGSGIYVVKDGQLIKTLSEKDGLTSSIILRITSYHDGFFVVTSNALNYMNEDRAERIEKFPYFNNFDLIIHKNNAWILSSGGIYVTNPDELLSKDEKPLSYRLYDYSNGLQGSITANSWTYIDEGSNLYFCSNVGIEKINMVRQKNYNGSYKMQILKFMADDKEIFPKHGHYELKAEVNEISIDASVFNYTLEDLKVRFFIEGLDEEPQILRQSTLDTISYSRIPNGTYKLRFQVLNDEEEVFQEERYTVVKEEELWETTKFKIYLKIFAVWMIIYVCWIVHILEKFFRQKKALEVSSLKLKNTVDEQTKKITEMQWNMIEGMASLIESRDNSTGEHIRNTATYVRMLAQQMYKDKLYPEIITKDYVEEIAMVAPLHDVGKVKISDLILNKPGRFTPEEYEIMKTHAALGGDVVKDILGKDADPKLIKLAQDIATYHHERWDGSGYPEGRKGVNIPLCARIMAVADVFDALVSKRVYKPGMTIDEAYEELLRGAGTQFQKEIVDVFVELRLQVSKFLESKKK